MKWNLRLAAAQRDIWKASQLQTLTTKYPLGRCHTCARQAVPVDDGVCRLCRRQASLIAGPCCKTALDLTAAASTGQQLFLAGFSRLARARSKPVALPRSRLTLVVASARPTGWEQPVLVDAPRDCRHASSLDPPRDPDFLRLVLRHADVLAEHNGWPPRTLQQVAVPGAVVGTVPLPSTSCPEWVLKVHAGQESAHFCCLLGV